MRERLIELLNETFADQYEKRCLLTADHTADYLLANGVIVPPCKVGDTVYQINRTPYGGEVYELDISGVSLRKGKTYYETESIDFDDTAIGRSIFLTRKEAEKALKEAQG